MSKKTISQMEAALLDRIESAKIKLEELKQKHKIEIGRLAYKHGLHELPLSELDMAFAKLAQEFKKTNGSQEANHVL